MKESHQRQCFCISLAVFALSFCTGMTDGLTGPSLPSLAERASVSSSEMSTIYTWRGCFGMVGSLSIGHLLDRFDPTVVLTGSLFFQAVFTSMAPWLSHLIAISAASALSAFFNGGVYAGTYTLIFRLHGRKASPYVQCVRMCYSGGQALAPLIAEPFIIDSKAEYNASNNVTNDNITNRTLSVAVNLTSKAVDYETNRVQFAFMIVASTTIFCSLIFVISGCCLKVQSLRPQGKATQVSDLGKTEVVLIALTLIMTFFYGGMDTGYGGLLFTLVTDNLSWSNGGGVLITSMFQIVKIVSVALAIVVAMVLHPKWLVGLDIVLLVGSSVSLLALIEKEHNIVIWVCTIVLGIGLGNIHSSNISWLGKRVPVSGKVSALFNVAFCGGIMAIAPLMGFALEAEGVRGLPIITTTCSAICFLMFVVLVCVYLKASSIKQSYNMCEVTEKTTGDSPIVDKPSSSQ